MLNDSHPAPHSALAVKVVASRVDSPPSAPAASTVHASLPLLFHRNRMSRCRRPLRKLQPTQQPNRVRAGCCANRRVAFLSLSHGFAALAWRQAATVNSGSCSVEGGVSEPVAMRLQQPWVRTGTAQGRTAKGSNGQEGGVWAVGHKRE